MTLIDAHAATRNLVENAFRYLTWHEDACKAAGFKGISQVWKDEPAWYFWLDSVQGGFLLRLHDHEPLKGSQYVSLSVHFYPSTSETKDCQLSIEEQRLLSDRSVFDMPTCTPRFEEFDACLPYFITAEIGLLIGSDNQLQLLVYSTQNGMKHFSIQFLDLLVSTLHFANKIHHRQALQLTDGQGTSLFLIYDQTAFDNFTSHFSLDEISFHEPKMEKLLFKWKNSSRIDVNCSMKSTCCCH
ncbi:hypothetical protein DSOUD_0718 [Desulfuromonas soudanensis]|uniref:Uncharacterized protein n=1 Tax=Desulfuromonas soudanensis TaxID=1603606 RepID=A0A0M5ITF3_9BACT|nr:hypothetical protein [Desulfuromonas soudanensis]ALC15506.1 hypothetical protein DSOUD_0718 [Desulfuromonas soudanensis]